MKKVTSLLLALVMVMSLLPTAVWAEGDDAVSLPTIQVDGRTVYFATEQSEGLLKSSGSVRPGTMGSEQMPVFVYTDANAGDPCFLAVDKNTFEDSAPTLTYHVEGDTKVFSLNTTGTNEKDKYVYELTVPEFEGNGVNYLFDLPRTDGSSEKDGFAVLFRKTGQGGEQGDSENVDDNVTRYHLEDKGRVCIIEGVNTSIRPDIPVELGIDWRESLKDVQVIGIQCEVVKKLAEAYRNTMVFGRYGIMTELTPVVLRDIAAQLDKIPGNENNLLWIRADYRNRDAEQGSAYAFRCTLWLGGNDKNVYVTPEGSTLRIGIDNSERLAENDTQFVVYTPDKNNKLTTDNDLTVDYKKFSDEERTTERFMVNTRSGGVFVVAPKSYTLNKDRLTWPWSGLNDDGGNDGGGDNIGDFKHGTDGKDWNGETDLRYMVIKSLRNMSDVREFIELGVDWRHDKIGSVQNVGITQDVLNEMVRVNKPVILYGAWGTNMMIPTGAVRAMADQLASMNVGKSEENRALLWLKLEYWNCDGPAGDAYAFRMRAFLGETHYELPENLTYTFQLGGQINNYTAFKLYCPEDQNEVSTALVEQENAVTYWVETGDDNSWRMYEFTANHDGMFVIAPADYDVKQNWPWNGVPLPDWHPSDKAIKPTRADETLQKLYDDAKYGENGKGFKSPCWIRIFTSPSPLR